MSFPPSGCGYVRIDEQYSPLSTEHTYLIYDLNLDRMNKLAIREKQELERNLANGQKALDNRQYAAAIDAFESVLRAVPRHPEASKGLEVARENAAKELYETMPSVRATIQANRALDQLLAEYGDRDHPKEVLERFRERLLGISEMFQTIRVSDLNYSIPKFPQLKRCYDKVDKQIRKYARADLSPMMEQRLMAIQELSLKNERHLNSILAHCRAWDQAYTEGAFLLGSDQMYNKTQIDQIADIANLAKQRLENIGSFFVGAIDRAILEVSPKWKMKPMIRIQLVSYYNATFMNSQRLRNQWMSLTRKGMEIFEEKIKSHVTKQIAAQAKSWLRSCFFVKILERKLSNQPPIFEEEIVEWLNLISASEAIVDISDRFKRVSSN